MNLGFEATLSHSFGELKLPLSQTTLVRVVIAIENKFSLTRLHELSALTTLRVLEPRLRSLRA